MYNILGYILYFACSTNVSFIKSFIHTKINTSGPLFIFSSLQSKAIIPPSPSLSYKRSIIYTFTGKKTVIIVSYSKEILQEYPMNL